MLSLFESLEQHAADRKIKLYTTDLPDPIKGLYFSHDDFHAITLSNALETSPERVTVLAEELGHYHTTPINLFTAPAPVAAMYERRAVAWAANALIPLSSIVAAWRAGVRSRWELAEYLGVTDEFTVRALELYRARCGLSVCVDGCLITFDLLHIKEGTEWLQSEDIN